MEEGSGLPPWVLTPTTEIGRSSAMTAIGQVYHPTLHTILHYTYYASTSV